MEIKQSGAQPSAKGPAEYFTGNVRIDPLFAATEPSRVSAALVTFEPGARTAWHTHPLGQRLVVTAGCGWVQCWDGPKREIRAGDVVACPPGEKHWHGGTATTGMSHTPFRKRSTVRSSSGSKRSATRNISPRLRPARPRHVSKTEIVTMPHVIVKTYPGRSEQQKAQLAETITQQVMAIARVGADAVSVAIEEITAKDLPEQVYRPDILGHADQL